jgi:hypothetical protein
LGTSASSHLRESRGGSFHYEPLVRRHYVSRRVGRWGGHARRDGTADGAGVAVSIAVGETGRADVGFAKPVACGGHSPDVGFTEPIGGTGRADVGFAEPVACSGRSADVGLTESLGGTGRADVGFAEPVACSGRSADVGLTESVGGAGRADVGFAKPIACGGRLGTARSSGISDPDADVDDASLTHPEESHNRIARSAVRFDSLDCAGSCR